MMNRLPRSCVAMIAAVAAIAVLVVLVTPAPEELPSTGPHALAKIFLAAAERIDLLPTDISSGHSLETGINAVWAGVDLLSYTCTRLC
jgi:hypothetical protein